MEEPEPLYRVPLSAEQRAELERRILNPLRQGIGPNEARAVLNLSEREAARIVHDYFPNAGAQVVILSTDTEADEAYYAQLKPYLAGAGLLAFDQCQELTTFQPGYFWEL